MIGAPRTGHQHLLTNMDRSLPTISEQPSQEGVTEPTAGTAQYEQEVLRVPLLQNGASLLTSSLIEPSSKALKANAGFRRADRASAWGHGTGTRSSPTTTSQPVVIGQPVQQQGQHEATSPSSLYWGPQVTQVSPCPWPAVASLVVAAPRALCMWPPLAAYHPDPLAYQSLSR